MAETLLDRKESFTEEEAPVVLERESKILKAQVLSKRLQGWSLNSISKTLGIPIKELEKHLVRWLREEVGHEDGELRQVLSDLTFVRYEELISRIYPALLEEGVTSNNFSRLIKIFQEVSDRQLKIAGVIVDETSGKGSLEELDITSLEEELARMERVKV